MIPNSFLVSVRCFTYNHASFIEQAMDGFVMQKTSFPYVCIIVDDFSNDVEQGVIRNYINDHFDLKDESVIRKEENDNYEFIFARHKTNKNCFWAVYLLKYNHYSKHKSKMQYISEWTDNAKYYALCEGDDYWIDPQKLQNQYDYMESHPECTMTCHRAKMYSERNKRFVGEQYCRKGDGVLNPVDIINRTGLYIPTCSLMFRPEIKNNYPDYCHNCNVGDYPLQITAAMKGTVYYFDKAMSVYRIENSNSWVGRQRFKSVDPARIHIVKSQMEMFKGFSKDYPCYNNVFKSKIAEHIIKNMPYWNNSEATKKYLNIFSEEVNGLCLKWKIYLWICRCPVPKVRVFYQKLFLSKYRTLRK